MMKIVTIAAVAALTLGMVGNPAQDLDQVTMLASGDARGHFIEWRTIAGDAALVQFDGHWSCRLIWPFPNRLLNDPRRAFA